MNTNFNVLFKRFLPFLYVILFAYLLCNILFFILPKNGFDFIKSSDTNLKYQRYDGFYSKKTVQQEKKKNSLFSKNTSLDKYSLKAIYSTSNNKGWINLEDKKSNNYILEYGEEIDGYTLSKIYKNYVEFEKNDTTYKLELTDEFGSSISKNSIKTSSNDESIINRAKIKSYTKDIKKVWDNIAINEYKKNDKIEGFKIDNIKKGSDFEKIGLKKGDIIKSVNNKNMDSYANAFNIYNKIDDIEYVNIQIIRNNEPMELNYEITK